MHAQRPCSTPNLYLWYTGAVTVLAKQTSIVTLPFCALLAVPAWQTWLKQSAAWSLPNESSRQNLGRRSGMSLQPLTRVHSGAQLPSKSDHCQTASDSLRQDRTGSPFAEQQSSCIALNNSPAALQQPVQHEHASGTIYCPALAGRTLLCALLDNPQILFHQKGLVQEPTVFRGMPPYSKVSCSAKGCCGPQRLSAFCCAGPPTAGISCSYGD